MKIKSHQTEVTAEDVSSNELELTISTVISPDDVFDLLDELPGHHFNQIAVRFTEDNGTVAYMLQSMDTENRVEAIFEGIEDPDDFVAIFREFEPKDRRRIIEAISDKVCVHCGEDHPGEVRRCQCWNDE